MNLPRIIGITGHARHGKDTVANHLDVRYGYTRFALADPLKDAAAHIFGFSCAQLHGDKKDDIDERYGITPRQALQVIGTEFGQTMMCWMFPAFAQKVGRRLWVNRLLEESKDDVRVVVSDVRFPHEAEAIKEAGGVVILVHRYGYKIDLSHESERAVKEVKYDYLVENCGTIETLRRNVDQVLHEMAGIRLTDDDLEELD